MGYRPSVFKLATTAAREDFRANFEKSHRNTVSDLICGVGGPPAHIKLYPHGCTHTDALAIANTARVGPKRVQGVLKQTIECLGDMVGGRKLPPRVGKTPLVFTTVNSQGQALPYSAVFPRARPPPQVDDKQAGIKGKAVGSKLSQIPWHTRGTLPVIPAADGVAEQNKYYDPLTTSPVRNRR